MSVLKLKFKITTSHASHITSFGEEEESGGSPCCQPKPKPSGVYAFRWVFVLNGAESGGHIAPLSCTKLAFFFSIGAGQEVGRSCMILTYQ